MALLRSGNRLQGRCRLQQAVPVAAGGPVHDTEPVANLGDSGVNSADAAASRSAYLGLRRLPGVPNQRHGRLFDDLLTPAAAHGEMQVICGFVGECAGTCGACARFMSRGCNATLAHIAK
jgi:hypothetical protein